MKTLGRNFGFCFIFAVVTVSAALRVHGDDSVLIRGDQSISSLSDMPVNPVLTHDIFSVRPRITARDELILLLGNADLFVVPPLPQAIRTSQVDKDFAPQKQQKVENGESP